MAEINGLLNRHTVLKPYRGFESLPHRKKVPGSAPSMYAFTFLTVLLLKRIIAWPAFDLPNKKNQGTPGNLIKTRQYYPHARSEGGGFEP